MFKAVILGAPGSGKGTISSRIVKYFDVLHISTGDMLRGEIARKTDLGTEAKKFIDAGKLVPDDVILNLLSGELKKMQNSNWLLDGFPRTRHQAEKLYDIQKINHVINLIVPFQVIIDRIKGRWIHVPSGRVYNEGFNSPKVPGKDDVTGEPLEQRDDDKPEIVEKRLQVYKETIDPVLEFYREKKIVMDFKGETSDEIWKELKVALAKFLKPRE